MSASGGQQGAGQHGRRQAAEHPYRALLPVEEAQHLETWRNPIAREFEIGLPSSMRYLKLFEKGWFRLSVFSAYDT